jgi:hypothetical protein
LTAALGSDERKPGHIYIFTRRSETNSLWPYVKIGKAEDVTDRLEQWKTRCHYTPRLEYKTALIPNALRAEQLVHMELIKLRYIEQQCSGCGRPHDEWFETDVDAARLVVGHWAKWMQDCRPYEEDGRLSSHIVQGIFERKLSQTPLTGKEMLVCASKDEQPTPESSHVGRTVHSIEHVDQASPSLRKSRRTAAVAVLAATSEDEDSPRPTNPARQLFGTGSGRRHVKRRTKRAGAVEAKVENAIRGLAADVEEATAKVEAGLNVGDPFLSDVKEERHSQEMDRDAESLPEPRSCAVAAKSEPEASSLYQHQPGMSGLCEGMGEATGVQCPA